MPSDIFLYAYIVLGLVIIIGASSCSKWEKIQRPIARHYAETVRFGTPHPKWNVSIKSVLSGSRNSTVEDAQKK